MLKQENLMDYSHLATQQRWTTLEIWIWIWNSAVIDSFKKKNFVEKNVI